MEVHGRILYVVGFDDTEAAISWQVAELAKGWRMPIVLLGVRRPRWLSFLEPDDRRGLKRATADVARRLRELRAPVAGIKVAIGDPATEARRVATQAGTSLIMVGAGIEAMDDPRAMSPCALAIARTARQDVWICKPFADPHFDHVLCAADTSPLAGEAVRRASALCRRFNARLRVVSVLPEPPAPRGATDDPDEAMLAGRREQRRFLDQFDLAGIALSRTIVWAAHAPVELLLEAEHYNDGLLVIGAASDTRGRGLGATAEPVLRACPSSVLIVRAQHRQAGGTTPESKEPVDETADGG
jgi:nucleotide-binding universal stress UspA family protein